ncbi:MAG: TetR/AcrR family transcriptional regulator [Actinomycetota bacterium]
MSNDSPTSSHTATESDAVTAPTTPVSAAADDARARSRLPGPERRAQVLAVARRVLSDSGFHGTTMSDIAEAAGVTKPVLYQHFASKRDLYRTVLTDIGDRLERAVIESAVAAPSPRERAEAGIRAFARFVEDDFDGFRLLFDGTNRHDEEWAVITRDVERSLAQAVAALIDVPSADATRRQVMAYGIIGLAESMMRQAKADGGDHYAEERLVGDITSLMWSGLRGIQP